jgi:hypothetical protein
VRVEIGSKYGSVDSGLGGVMGVHIKPNSGHSPQPSYVSAIGHRNFVWVSRRMLLNLI